MVEDHEMVEHGAVDVVRCDPRATVVVFEVGHSARDVAVGAGLRHVEVKAAEIAEPGYSVVSPVDSRGLRGRLGVVGRKERVAAAEEDGEQYEPGSQ
jgi:hypothetical protein